ncbi:MAG: DUF4272 domain-containing protein [Myxococcales bacterium]|nr:DUF4272 domain-containing protein [Myxococcales bacterium]
MNAPPLNVFSHRIAPAAVVAVLRTFGPVTLDGTDDAWTRATLSLKTGWFGRTSLVVTHNEDYYAGPGWAAQVHGMRGFFARAGLPPDVESAIGGLRFSVALLDAADALDKNDKRLDVVAAIANELDGMVFCPGYLLDRELRVLLGPDGARDPDAVTPRYPTNLFTLREPESGATLGAEAREPDDDDVERDPVPPTPERVARRALVMAATTARALSEAEEEDDLPGLRGDLWKWVEDCGLTDECEPREAAFLQLDGRPKDQDMLNACWRVEGLAVLMWALGHVELPRYDTLVTPRELWKVANIFGPPENAGEFVASATLRSSVELDALNAHLLAFHWRMVDFRLRPVAMDFVAFSKNCWFGSFPVDDFEIIDADLALGGKRVDVASQDARDTASSTAQERHLASNWLRGDSDVYSETDVST